MISHFELHYFVKPSENAFLDYPHHVNTTKCHKEENEHDEARCGKLDPCRGQSHVFSEDNENSCCPPCLRKELFLLVPQDFERKKYIAENKFLSCSKSIQFLCAYRKLFYFRCCADGFIGFLYSNNETSR